MQEHFKFFTTKKQALYRLLAIVLTLHLFTAFTTSAQNKSATEKLAESGYSLRFTNLKRGIQTLNQALKQAKSNQNQEDEAICYAYLALTYKRSLDLKNFAFYANAAYATARNAKSRRADAYACMAMGFLKSYIEDQSGAIQYLLKAYTLFSALKEYEHSAKIAANISYLFSPGSPKKVFKYATAALDFANKAGDQETILHARLAMGSYYMDKIQQGDRDTWQLAIIFFKKTVALAEAHETQIVTKSNIGVAYINLAALYADSPQPIDNQEFLTNLEKAIKIGKAYRLKNVYRSAAGLKGQYFLAKGDYDRAQKLFMEGIAYQKTLPYKDNYLMANFYNNLKQLAVKRQDYKSYYHFDTLFTRYNNLKNEESTQNMLQNADARFESDKKLARIQQLQKDNRLQHDNQLLSYGISAILLLGLVFMFRSYYFRQRYYQNREDKLKQERANSDLQLQLLEKETLENLSEKLSLQRRLLASQMDPHFIFNALGNIQSMILQKDTAQAITYLGKFAKLTRQVLEQSRMETISLEEEIHTLKNYIELQQLRLNNGFDYQISCDEHLNIETRIPPLLIQPFVENAIEHGLKPIIDTGKGLLNIHFSISPAVPYLTCTVTDNGIGLEASKRHKKGSNHQSMATTITSERLTQMQKENTPASFEVAELTETSTGKGCIVTLRIPIH